MSSINRRHSGLIGVAAVGALLVAAPTAQAQVGLQDQQARTVRNLRALVGPDASAGASRAKAAAADPSACVITGYSPTSVVVGGGVIKKNFTAKVSGCTVAFYAVAAGPFLDPNDEDSLDGVSVTGAPTAVLDPHYLINDYAGKHADFVGVAVLGDGEDPETTEATQASFPFTILRKASFSSSFNASPEPVKKGKKITIKGTLKRINFNQAKKLGYVGYPKAPVQIQFKASGAKSYTTITTIKAGKGGTISTRVVAKKSGTWRLFFPGNGVTSDATSGTDAVKVN